MQLCESIFALLVFAAFTEATVSRRLEAIEKRNQQAVIERQASHGAYFPSPAFWPDLVVYEVMTDRFNDGNLSNDDLNLPPSQVAANEANASWGIWDWRHGGDVQGITDRLDYLADLGVGSIWLTPILKCNGDYHGYCTTDLTELDPGFATQDELIRFVDAAHNRSIRVVMDIVINHMCGRGTLYSTQPDHQTCPDDLNLGYWEGQNNSHASSQGTLSFGPNFFEPFTEQNFFNRCGPDSTAEMQGETPAAVFGDFTSEMFDYDTRDKDFQQLFTSFHKYWIAAADIDGYRLDAAKHVTEDYLAYFSTEIRSYAQSLGKDNFFVIGEVAASPSWIGRRLGNMFTNPAEPAKEHGNIPLSQLYEIESLQSIYSLNPSAVYPGLTAVYDFDESGTSRSVLQQAAAPIQIQDYFSSSYYSTIAAQNDYRFSWTMLEIHDWTRFANSDPTDEFLSMIGLAYLLTGPGTPIIYYGLEQGFNGRCAANSVHCGNYSSDVWAVCNAGTSDALKRQDMFVGGPWRLASTMGNMSNTAFIGRTPHVPSPPWQQDPFLDLTNAVYRRARAMTRLRNSCLPLRRGSFQVTWGDDTTGGLLAFNRRIQNVSEIVVIMNTNSNEWRDLTTMQFYLDSTTTPGNGTIFLNAMDPTQTAVAVRQGPETMFLHPAAINLIPRGVLVFVRSDLLDAFDPLLGVALCTKG